MIRIVPTGTTANMIMVIAISVIKRITPAAFYVLQERCMTEKRESMAKQYGSAQSYEAKLLRVMERLGVKDYDYNFDRHGCWVQFKYRGEVYRFDHSVAKAKSRGVNLAYGSDAFAQVVLALEDLARMVERGIYDLSTWVAGLRFLPPPVEVPACFKVLGFVQVPASVEDVKDRYRTLAKERHPDAGGSSEEFQKLTDAKDLALAHFTEE
jgi:hypothetical protein